MAPSCCVVSLRGEPAASVMFHFGSMLTSMIWLVAVPLMVQKRFPGHGAWQSCAGICHFVCHWGGLPLVVRVA